MVEKGRFGATCFLTKATAICIKAMILPAVPVQPKGETAVMTAVMITWLWFVLVLLTF